VTSKERVLEIQNDLDITKMLYKRSRSKEYRRAINKLRYILIVEKNNISSDNGKDY
jgi:hypothetical protein